MNTNMLVTIDEDTLGQVAGGTCIDPCALVGEVLGAVECVAGAGAELVCGVVEAKVNFATKLLGIFGC